MLPIEEAIQREMVDSDFAKFMQNYLHNLWNAISGAINENHLEEPSYIFITNEDLCKIMGSTGQLELTYYYPHSNSIFINIDVKEFDLSSFGVDAYNVFANLFSSLLVYEQTEKGERPNALNYFGIKFPERTDQSFEATAKAQGKAMFMQVKDDINRNIEDISSFIPFEAFRAMKFQELLMLMLLRLVGEKITGAPIEDLRFVGISTSEFMKDDIKVDFMEISEEQIRTWFPIVYNYVKFGKAFFKDFNNLSRTDKLFKQILNDFLGDVSDKEKVIYERFNEILHRVRSVRGNNPDEIIFEDLSLSDRIERAVVFSRFDGFVDIKSILNSKEINFTKDISERTDIRDTAIYINTYSLYSIHPIIPLLEAAQFEAGMFKKCILTLSRSIRTELYTKRPNLFES